MTEARQCERKIGDRACTRTAVAFVMGQHVCTEHDPSGAPKCSHSLSPTGRCAYCGGTPTEGNPA